MRRVPSGGRPHGAAQRRLLAEEDGAGGRRGAREGHNGARPPLEVHELYDLEADPRETINRIDDPDAAAPLAELRGALLQWLQTTSDVVPRDFDRRWTNASLWAKVRPLVPAGYEEDVKEKIRSGMGIGAVFGYCAGLRKGAQKT